MLNQKIPEWQKEFNEVFDKRVMWDLIKYRVRQFKIKYAKKKQKKEGKNYYRLKHL